MTLPPRIFTISSSLAIHDYFPDFIECFALKRRTNLSEWMGKDRICRNLTEDSRRRSKCGLCRQGHSARYLQAWAGRKGETGQAGTVVFGLTPTNSAGVWRP